MNIEEKKYEGYTSDELRNFHKLSSNHRTKLEKAKTCGCFYCGKVYSPKEIIEWCDKDNTALCPKHCGIDAVLPMLENIDFPTLLEAMHQFYFLRGTDSEGRQVGFTDRRKKKFNA